MAISFLIFYRRPEITKYKNKVLHFTMREQFEWRKSIFNFTMQVDFFEFLWSLRPFGNVDKNKWNEKK